MYSNDLVVNGNFSAGNTGFATNYALGTGGTWGPVSNAGTYSITTDPNLAHTNFSHFGDHTTGTGNMMVVNGSNTSNAVVWSQTITVTPNTMYNFSAWLASPSNESALDVAQLQFSINGSLIGPVATAPLTAGVWTNFFVNWNSGVSTSAAITIVDNVLTGNNDFVLDDIFFQQVCSASDSIIVSGSPQPTVTASTTNSVICSGNSTTLNGGGASTYIWTGGVTNGVAFNPTGTTTYTVTGTSAIGCTNTAVQTITVNTLPTLTINTPTACMGASALFTASGASSYTWSPTTGLSSSTGSVVTGNPNSTTVYSVSGTNNGCIGTVTGTFMVVPLPSVGLTASSNTVLNMESVSITASGGGTYVWSTGETSATINLNPQQTTAYCATVTSAAGCKNSDCINITVMETSTIYVPNVFTPNGDGVNDVYFLMSTNITSFNLNIFNRWGQLIFNSNQPSKGWDGTYGGKEVPDGVYIYIIDAKGIDDVIYKKTGHVTVMR